MIAKKLNVPTLRFPAFQGEWNKKKLGEMFHFISTNSLSRKDLNEHHGEIKNIHYGDIHTRYSQVLDVENESIPFISSGSFNFKDEQFGQNGDLVIADASEDVEGIGKTIELVGISGSKIVGGLHTLHLRSNEKNRFSPGFLGFAMNSDLVQNQFRLIATGAKVLGITKINTQEIELSFPCKIEQQKIASFFSLLDQRIGKQQEKISCLEEYKKGLMQKIFSQEIRFKDENGKDYPEWETKRIGNVFDERTERGRPNLELLSVTISEGVIKRTNIDGKDNSSEDKSNYKVVEIGDIVYNSMRMWQGANGVSSYKGITSPAYTVLKNKTAVHPGFFGYLFKTKSMIGHFQRHSQGLTSDTWNLKYPQLSKIKVHVPCLSEQRKIEQFLSGIDELIKLNLEFLEQWKLLKKGLLQQMFV